MIKAIFFDIDGTLLDFDAYVRDSMREGFKEFGYPEYREEMWPVFHRVNSALWQRIEQGTLTFPELMKIRWNSIFEAIGITGDGEAFEEYFRSRLFTSAIPVEGADEILEYLSGRCIICAASNGPFLQQQNRIRLAGWEKYFKYLFISQELGAAKPAAEFYDRAMQRLRDDGLNPASDEILMVGDSLSSDMTGGVNYGLKTCWFNPQGKETDLPVDYVIGSLAQLRDIV